MSSFSNRINEYRRIVMRKITKNIGASTSSDLTNYYTQEGGNVKKILVSRPNSRLGNQLLVLPLVETLEKLFPNAKIDLFVRGGLSPIIFENYKCINKYICLPKKPFKQLYQYAKVWMGIKSEKYDIAINIAVNSSSGRLSTSISKAKIKIFNDEIPELTNRYTDYKHIAKFPVYNLLYAIGLLPNDAPNPVIPPLDLRLSNAELDNGKKVLEQYTDPTKETIAIYTFATGDKCYSPSWWNPMYDKLVTQFGNTYNILEVLPAENVSQIDFKAKSYYSRDIREMAAVIANTKVFITADCGIMHLASATITPVVALFSITHADTYRPYNQKSIAIDTNTENSDQIIETIKNILTE